MKPYDWCDSRCPNPCTCEQTIRGAPSCPFCFQPLNDGDDLYTDADGVTAHAGCHDMERSAAFGDWVTAEYDGAR